jgi:hypothetical protein
MSGKSVEWELSCYLRTDGRLEDKRDEADSCFSQFGEHA